MKPNIVLITVDQMRGDCLGILGHPDVKTPYLDTLASRGVLFENAYTACPSCIAARCGLMTGLAPKNHGRVGYKDGIPWRYEHTMAGELAKLGYHTENVGKLHTHPLRNSLGFHHSELHDGYLHYYRRKQTPYYEYQPFADDYIHYMKEKLGVNADITDAAIECNSWIARPWPYEERLHPTNWVVDRCIDFLRRRDRDQPFFLHAGFVRPHPPFDAPQCFFDLYRDKALREPFIGDWADLKTYKTAGVQYDSPEGIADPENQRQAQIGYYACITHVDHQIGRLLMELEMNHTEDPLLIIFTSDHGELLGDHHTFRKSRAYEGSANVPFIVWSNDPKLMPKRGQKLTDVIELRDIMPTFLAAAGCEDMPALDGTSLLNVLQGDTTPVREYLHGEHSGGASGNQFIVTEHDKYIWFMESGKEQYFDLDVDPHELHDAILDPQYADRIAYLRSLLIRELTGREEGYTDGEKLLAGKEQRAYLHTVLG